MRVGFLNNQIDNRGTGNALYDYAAYNESILGNESCVYIMSVDNPDIEMAEKITRRFGGVRPFKFLLDNSDNLDVLYHIKYGTYDGLSQLPMRYAVHAVFDGSQPHGDRYATISPWMGARYKIPYVPHIVQIREPPMDFRYKYKIPNGAKLIGRHGGPDSFDIPWVWSAINKVLQRDPQVYFIFLGTDVPDVTFYDLRRVIFVPKTANDYFKSSFIYACDAMLHARSRGETFGIAVGEFAIAGKLVFTYGDSGERAHIEQLGGLGYLYYNEDDLVRGLLEANTKGVFRSSYDQFTPENVMRKFKEVFLD